jgi:hypothetical protein
VQPVTDCGERLVEADVGLRDAVVVALLQVQRGGELRRVAREQRTAEAEAVQVAVAPAHRRLQHLVQGAQRQVRGQLEAPPHRRTDAREVDAHAVGHHLLAARVQRWPLATGRGEGHRARVGAGGGEHLLDHARQVGRRHGGGEPGDRLAQRGWQVVAGAGRRHLTSLAMTRRPVQPRPYPAGSPPRPIHARLVYREYPAEVAQTTIKVDTSLRDRLNEEARRDGVPVGRLLEALLAERARSRRFARMRAAMAATPADQQQSYQEETTAWGTADGDGLRGA